MLVAEDLENYKAIKEACFYYLARREQSQYELLQKLSNKGFSKSDIQQVIDELKIQGLQSDARFVESYARSRVHKGVGPLKIKAELQQRGVGGYCFDRAVEDIAGSWEALLMQTYLKKYSDQVPQGVQEQLKRSRFLQQRGFPNNMIRQLFKQLNA